MPTLPPPAPEVASVERLCFCRAAGGPHRRDQAEALRVDQVAEAVRDADDGLVVDRDPVDRDRGARCSPSSPSPRSEFVLTFESVFAWTRADGAGGRTSTRSGELGDRPRRDDRDRDGRGDRHLRAVAPAVAPPSPLFACGVFVAVVLPLESFALATSRFLSALPLTSWSELVASLPLPCLLLVGARGARLRLGRRSPTSRRR